MPGKSPASGAEYSLTGSGRFPLQVEPIHAVSTESFHQPEAGRTYKAPGLVSLPEGFLRILNDLKSAGYPALLVGGSVRDALLGVAAKDLDLEVYGIGFAELANFLGSRGRVDLVGQAFGVVKFRSSAGMECDFSVPRRDSKIGVSHRDFYSSCDPSMTIKEAASRRDFTINSMAFDPLRGELYDYFGGRDDLRAKVLRATSAAFKEDPLRVLRGAQFACRFDLEVDPDTAAVCRSIAGEFDTLPKERICEEFMKWATKSTRPGRLIGYLDATGWLGNFPLLASLQAVPQDAEWHPEGDVAVHTMHVVDAAARIAMREGLDDFERCVLLMGALTHDLAKAGTTELRDVRGAIRWTSYGHDKASGPKARMFLESVGIKEEIIERVVPLVENHLAHHDFRSEDTPARTARRLATRLAPANIRELALLIEADASGRPPLVEGLPEAAGRMLRLATELRIEVAPEKPLIFGRHVLPYFKGVSGPRIGRVVQAAYEAQLDGAFTDMGGALEWLSGYMSEFSPGDGETG
jgi:tRNA nucleotidyltransferase (CCA-adding enzyme)